MAVPFRYQVGATEVMKTSCFRPNAIGPNFDPEKHKPSSLGAVYMGQMNRVPRQDINKKVALVWEAGWLVNRSLHGEARCLVIAHHFMVFVLVSC